MNDRISRLIDALAGPPRPAQGVTSYTVPVIAQPDGDEEAAMAWLDEKAEEAGRFYAERRWPGAEEVQ